MATKGVKVKDPSILNFYARQRREITFTSWPVYPREKLVRYLSGLEAAARLVTLKDTVAMQFTKPTPLSLRSGIRHCGYSAKYRMSAPD
jgi:hypothetical protein